MFSVLVLTWFSLNRTLSVKTSKFFFYSCGKISGMPIGLDGRESQSCWRVNRKLFQLFLFHEFDFLKLSIHSNFSILVLRTGSDSISISDIGSIISKNPFYTIIGNNRINIYEKSGVVHLTLQLTRPYFWWSKVQIFT